VKQAAFAIAMMTSLAATSCKHEAPAPPPDPEAWRGEAAKLMPFLPPMLGPCSSTASAETSHTPRDQGGSDYEARRTYDCTGRSMQLSLHAGNVTAYTTELDGRHSNFGSDSKTTYKDVMLGGGRGIHMASTGNGRLDLVLPERIVVTAHLEHPSPPDELLPIVNNLDFKGLSKIAPQQVP